MAGQQVLTSLDLSDCGLKKIASGKVREIFELDQKTLLFVATDRISAYDVILDNGNCPCFTLLVAGLERANYIW